MSTKTKAPESTWRTGWCNPTSAAWQHARCPGSLTVPKGALPCTCPCHTAAPEPTEPAVPRDLFPAPSADFPFGFFDGVAEADYHGDRATLSHSGIKTILGRSPLHFRYEQLHPRPFKRVFEFGSAAHALVLGVGDPIAVLDFEDRRTKAYKEAEAEARDAGHTPLLRREYDVVQAMADRLSSHTLAMELLSEGRPEVSAYARDEETGVVRRCRFDWLHPAVLVDYKSAESADPRVFGRKAADYGYHIQAPYYLDIAAALGHPAEAFAFIVQEKAAPYVVSVVELPEASVQRGRELYRRALAIYRDCVAAGVWPAYVDDATPALAGPLPAYAFYDNEVEIA